MVIGIQITQADNAALLNSFGYWMTKKMKLAVFALKLILMKDKLLPRRC